jgi:hypothetical protein
LLRGNLAPKAVYRGLQKLIGVHWHTRAAGQTDAAGCFRFRGFRGTYRVVVRSGDRPTTVALFSLGPRSLTPFTFGYPDRG